MPRLSERSEDGIPTVAPLAPLRRLYGIYSGHIGFKSLGFPKIWGTFLAVPTIRIIVRRGLY